MKFLLFIALYLILGTPVESSDSELHLGKFSTGDLSGWKDQTIGLMKAKTTYKLTKDNDRTVLIAHSTKAASGQIYKMNLEPKEFPILKWSWKIDHIIKKGDEKTKDGDDFAARVYVVFPRGFFSKTRAICYVWANKLPRGEHVVSPFTTNIITVAADSGEELAGHWTFHQRNIYEDYKTFFGEEPPKIGAVAIMTDTDNTGESAVGYYGDIFLMRLPKMIDGKLKDQKAKETPLKEQKLKDPIIKDIKNGTEPALPAPDLTTPVKSMDDQKHRELNNKEQPPGKPVLPTAVAPKPQSQQ